MIFRFRLAACAAALLALAPAALADERGGGSPGPGNAPGNGGTPILERGEAP